ncbi:MAG: PD-(D/E)XK nuclease family transposase [Microscillaceae bacterium]|nr:PD-(D/E)XK nuclease family transposase [Microscillaceae bacterium]
MILARLDNEVFFKKAFTDEIVFKAFVKDIVGIEIEPHKIETEKAFQPKIGNIAFKYDIFAEDIKRRIVIEIQKVEYDHNFDRFLHYHLQAITEQQRSSEDYSVEKTVYTIVIMTAPYKINPKTHQLYKDEVLISSLNPKNLKDIECKIFNHELIFLNPNYKGQDTPQNYRDWLDLIYESIHNPENPQINTQNAGVKRVTEIVSYENISPEEWEEAKIEASKRQVITLEREEERKDTQKEIAKNLLQTTLPDAEIAKHTGLTIEQIEQLRKEL